MDTPAIGEEIGTGYFSRRIHGRPRFLNVDSRPNVDAMVTCQVSAPNNCCRLTQVRSVVNRVHSVMTLVRDLRLFSSAMGFECTQSVFCFQLTTLPVNDFGATQRQTRVLTLPITGS